MMIRYTLVLFGFLGSALIKVLSQVPAITRLWKTLLRRQGELAACCSVFLCMVAAAHAQPLVIGVKFASELGGTLAPTDSAGVVPSINWNATSGNSGAVSGLVADNGTPSGLVTGSSVTWGGPTDDSNLGGTPTGPDQNMMFGYVDAGSGGPLTINVAGLPASIAANYAVLVYIAGNSAGQVGDYTIGGTTLMATQGVYNAPYSLAGNGVEGNYIEFSGLSGGSFSLSAALTGFRARRCHSDRAGTATYMDGIAKRRVEHPSHRWTEELAGQHRRRRLYGGRAGLDSDLRRFRDGGDHRRYLRGECYAQQRGIQQ